MVKVIFQGGILVFGVILLGGVAIAVLALLAMGVHAVVAHVMEYFKEQRGKNDGTKNS